MIDDYKACKVKTVITIENKQFIRGQVVDKNEFNSQHAQLDESERKASL